VGAAVGVVFDALYDVLAGYRADVVDSSDPAAYTAAAMAHYHATAIVAAAFAVPDFGEGEFGVGLAFPEMVVDGAAEMAETGGSGGVCFELEGA